jgi:hypothetical protein
MKHSGAIALITCLILAIVWWNWPDWGRPEYWFPRDHSIITIAGCQRGQLTTMRPHDGGSLIAVALNDLAALTIFEKPTDLLDSHAVEARLQRGIADISRKVEHFFALIEQGQVVRIPEKKLIRYVQPSEFADWIVEVEVFRRGDKALRGFAHWKDLDCWKFE